VVYATLIEIDVRGVDREEGLRGLQEGIVPAISAMPGFLTVWESEAGAQAMAERFGVGSSPQANAAVTRCEVREVAATAGPPGQ
jgi:hypothetical protein